MTTDKKRETENSFSSRIDMMRALRGALQTVLPTTKIHYDPDEDETLMYLDDPMQKYRTTDPRFECLFDVDRNGVFRNTITYALPVTNEIGQKNSRNHDYGGFQDDHGHWYIVHKQVLSTNPQATFTPFQIARRMEKEINSLTEDYKSQENIS